MARYDAGWGHPFGFGGYDQAYRPYVPPRAGFRGGPHPYDAPWGDAATELTGQGEEYPDDGSVYGPARYGLGPYYERLRRRTRPDAELREEVEEALFFDTWVDADAVTVEVKDGIVTLRGELPDYDEIRYATDDAWDVDGVRGVHSELTVRGATPRPRE
ncbi:MAG: BON domain-containing protein, partial [Gemmatimonadota bacterium]|nr:BON domain-containing protein [Gemmatimonadota bacterium]